MTSDPRYMVAGSRPWNRRVFDEVVAKYPGVWRFIAEAKELNIEGVDEFAPEFIFFLHWSWKVPVEITQNYKCIAFHMTDVPYGRGGSPLQNLIIRGHKETKLTALKMVEEFDAGPVYLKEDLGLSGSAEEVYVRASYLSARMIRRIIDEHPVPVPQEGEPTLFKRRSPDESRMESLKSLCEIHDFIRMLDAEGYPRAFARHGQLRLTLSDASVEGATVLATVRITVED